MRLLWVVGVLAVLAVAGLSAYAYFGDMTPERREMRLPISLTGEPLPEAAPAAEEAAPAPEPDAGAQESGASGEAPAAGADVLD